MVTLAPREAKRGKGLGVGVVDTRELLTRRREPQAFQGRMWFGAGGGGEDT